MGSKRRRRKTPSAPRGRAVQGQGRPDFKKPHVVALLVEGSRNVTEIARKVGCSRNFVYVVHHDLNPLRARLHAVDVHAMVLRWLAQAKSRRQRAARLSMKGAFLRGLALRQRRLQRESRQTARWSQQIEGSASLRAPFVSIRQRKS